MTQSSFYINKVGPVHAAHYISTDQVLLASGAGPSKTGQKNRIATYSIAASLASSEKEAERQGVSTGEVLLSDDEDAPSSLAIAKDLIIAGVNESTAIRKKTGDNHHLRTFRISTASDEKGETTKINTLPQHQIFDDLSLENDDYQKVTKVNSTGTYAALISSDGYPAVVDLAKMTKLPLEPLDGLKDGKKIRIVDLELTNNALFVANANSITSISLPSADDVSILFHLDRSGVPKNFRLSNILILSTDKVLVGMTDVKLSHSFIAIYRLYKGQLIQGEVAHTSSKIRGLYTSTRHASPTMPQLIAMTTANGDLTLFDATLQKIKTWRKLHQFPISSVAFRPDGRQLITASIDEKVNVLEIGSLSPETSLETRIYQFLAVLLLLLFLIVYATGQTRPLMKQFGNLVAVIPGRRR